MSGAIAILFSFPLWLNSESIQVNEGSGIILTTLFSPAPDTPAKPNVVDQLITVTTSTKQHNRRKHFSKRSAFRLITSATTITPTTIAPIAAILVYQNKFDQ